MATMKVHLYRDSLNTAWGFRLQGGKDLNQPLVIQRVFSNSPAEGELQRGDVILFINGRDTDSYTHKQAQDTIKFGGGQLELLIQRPPPGRVHVAPLTPTSSTKAPTFPQSPTKAPTVIIPIQRRHSGPPSPIRSPVRSPSRPSNKPQSESSMPQPYTSGFRPKKVTLNKYGGGGYDFGTTPSPKYKPVQPSFKSPAVQQQSQYGGMSAPQYQSPPAQQYRSSADELDSQMQYQQPQQQLSPEDRGVEEEEYGGVSERRRQFMQGEQRRPVMDFESDEDDYPTAPVWERRKIFSKSLVQNRAINRTNKIFKPKRPIGEGTSFGVDYVTGQGFAPPPPASKPAPRPRPPPVNATPQDDVDAGGSPWSSTLKSDGLKPWEREQMIQDAYQNQPPHVPYRPGVSPQPAPKPKITKITTQSKTRSTQQQSGAGQSKPVTQIGDRDWSDSYVYKMIHEEKKTSSQGVQGQPDQTVTTTRVTNESVYPGQAPKCTVQETVTTSSLDSRFDDELGISDF